MARANGEIVMMKLVGVFCICLTAFRFFPSPDRSKVGTITEVHIHRNAEKVGASNAPSYDVSVKVGNAIYVVLYTSPLREETVKYAAGRDLLAFVGKGTIRYNDLLGQSYEVPIESQRPADNPTASKPASQATQ